MLIATGGSDRFYRSVDEVPSQLRLTLQKSTNGENSATIVIADQRGRQEIANALRGLPGAPSAEPAWLTPMRKRILAIAILALALAIIAAAVAFGWR